MCLLHIFQEQTIFWVGKAQPFPLEQTQKKFLNFFFFFSQKINAAWISTRSFSTSFNL